MVQARQASDNGCYIAGLSEAPIENVTIRDCNFEQEAINDVNLPNRIVSEKREGYPSMEIFGLLPSFGVFVRDANNVCLQNIKYKI